MTNKEKVEACIRKGVVEPKEIADETGLSMAVVYNCRSMLKKENKELFPQDKTKRDAKDDAKDDKKPSIPETPVKAHRDKDKSVTHMQICHQLNNIYKKKNNDYGNSFGESFKEFGPVSAVVRMDDKMRRIKQLIKHDPEVVSESLEDSLLDIANYAIMLLIELEKSDSNV